MRYSYREHKETDSFFDIEKFKNTETRFYPVMCWSWNRPVERDEIARQLDSFYDNNIRRVYILPMPRAFRPSNLNNLDPDYLTDEFFEIIRFAYKYAEKKGMQVWIYDEGGWPSGSACGKVVAEKPHLASKNLAVRSASSPYTPSVDAVAAFCGGKRIYEGFSSDSEITEYYMKRRDGDYPNLAEAETTDTFIKLTHERYKQYTSDLFGSTVYAVFTDEPTTEATGWCDGFEKRFYERYGYDLLDFLPYIYEDDKNDVDEKGQAVRIDYFNLLAEVFAENYFLKIRDWCRENNLVSTGHLDKDNATYDPNQKYYSSLRQLRSFDMPGIDVIWRQLFPGRDNHFYPRFSSSAANQTGNPFVMSETFSIYGAGVSFDTMRHMMLYQMSRGINTINLMSLTYNYDGLNRKNARPGFMPLMPTWKPLGDFCKYTARASYLTSLGVSGNRHAVFMPLFDFWAGGRRKQEAIESFDKAVYKAEELHIPVDIIDLDFLETAEIRDGMLCTGTAKYSAVIIPENVTVDENSRKKLDEFVCLGGKIIMSDDLDDSESVVDISCDGISVFRRILDDGVLYLINNESTEEKSFSFTFGEKGNIYELDALGAEIYAVDSNSVTFAPGEGTFYFITDRALPANTKKKPKGNCITVDQFEVKQNWKFVIGEERFEKYTLTDDYIKTKPCDWCELYGKDFSGECTYKFNFALKEIPDFIEVDLGNVNYACDAYINDTLVSEMCFGPFRFKVDRKHLKAENEMRIIVSNTTANQVCATKSFDEIPVHIMGPYHNIVKEFEHESIPSGLLSLIKIYY
ncbi:MAG: hypothetical protein IKU43_05580 [Clostridia bacterium]|nr:hypothetical protein [Clostridia bacterium]